MGTILHLTPALPIPTRRRLIQLPQTRPPLNLLTPLLGERQLLSLNKFRMPGRRLTLATSSAHFRRITPLTSGKLREVPG